MVIDTKHPLAKYAKVRDGAGNLIKTAYWVDTDAGLCRQYVATVVDGKMKVQTEPDPDNEPYYRLAVEEKKGKFTVTFEGVPFFKRVRFQIVSWFTDRSQVAFG